jgi:hypothetical protein
MKAPRRRTRDRFGARASTTLDTYEQFVPESRMRVVERLDTLGGEDHVTLARFTDVDDKPLYVNPDRVTVVREHGEGSTTTISFSEQHTVTVKMKVGEVAAALFSAVRHL